MLSMPRVTIAMATIAGALMLAWPALAQGVTPPLVSLLEYQLLLPGPYGACSPEAVLHGSRGD